MHGEQAERDSSGVLASACLVQALKGQANDGTRNLIGIVVFIQHHMSTHKKL